ncbi:MAG: folylpolyglutamate synthase/dihydrofolate synthase family protein [Candidatus Thermoplasmatota archaeon]
MVNALDWINSFEKYGSSYGLERVSYLADKLGNPQYSYSVIHVAGTNGKGSVSRYIAYILKHAGYRTGLYLSPHLERFHERISIDNTEISDEELEEFTSKIKPIVEDMMKNGTTPTYFEIVTVLAFLYFKEMKVDYAVIETGLGGRLDATNIVKPVISIITNISLEHTDILGNSIESIAWEKAGIIKPGVSVITAAKAEARRVIKNESEKRGATLITVDDNDWRRVNSTLKGQVFHVHGRIKDYQVHTTLLGLFQGENVTLAIKCIEELQMKGVFITEDDILRGVASTIHPGRFQVLSENPLIIIDGAHNKDGVDKLVKTLKEDIKPRCRELIVLFGVLKDKDIDGMLTLLLPISDVFIITRSNNQRACEPSMVYDKIKNLGLKNDKVILTKDITEAMETARCYIKDNNALCITGSLYTVGEAYTYIKKHMKIVQNH